uniref:Uncharacterized protein n=1 Tax=Aegilops tauschii subsp. strangulata TaxID=200361 RepID=A0A453LXI3_AEGTS
GNHSAHVPAQFIRTLFLLCCPRKTLLQTKPGLCLAVHCSLFISNEI